MMRALTLWQPMAWAVAEGHKPVENRVWTLPEAFVGQDVAIHAGKRYDASWAETIRSMFTIDVPQRSEIALGAVIAVVRFTASLDRKALHEFLRKDMPSIGLQPDQFAALHRWYSGPYGFVCADVRKLAEPVPARGFQGLWALPDDIKARVEAQLPKEARDDG